MKLELKHLSPYLPYGFKFISEMDKPYDEFGEVRVWTANGIIKLFGNFCLNTYENNDAYGINLSKPILFPLSSLTKEITVNGESFVPLVHNRILKQLCNESSLTSYYHLNLMENYEIISMLFELKFDFFGLIEAGLAEPVTEDFNPYK